VQLVLELGRVQLGRVVGDLEQHARIGAGRAADLEQVDEALGVLRVVTAGVDDRLEARERRLVEPELVERDAQRVLGLLDERVLRLAGQDELLELQGRREEPLVVEQRVALAQPLRQRGVGDDDLGLEVDDVAAGVRRRIARVRCDGRRSCEEQGQRRRVDEVQKRAAQVVGHAVLRPPGATTGYRARP